MLSKKEESGDIVCNDEFDTISLDRLGTMNRDSAVNRSNRSCPGFKTSLPNISENNEQTEETTDKGNSFREKDINCNNHVDVKESSHLSSRTKIKEAVNVKLKHNIFEPRENNNNRTSITSNISTDYANFDNECYESYTSVMAKTESSETCMLTENKVSSPKPIPRAKKIIEVINADEQGIYENLPVDKKSVIRPTPAARTHVPTKISTEINSEQNNKTIKDPTYLYENVLLAQTPEPPKRMFNSDAMSKESSQSTSRTSSISSDSLIDESNLEDILLSEKSRSFRHGKNIVRHNSSIKSNIHRTQSGESNFTDVTGTSAIENVDCSDDLNDNPVYLAMSGTLPSKRQPKPKQKLLFRHKTFTNIEVDRNSLNLKTTFTRKNSFLKETLAHYHIRGTGHCIYQAPTVQEFIYVFNRDALYTDIEPFEKVAIGNQRDSYFETAICFCKPQPPKHHNSAEDLLDIQPDYEEAKVSIDMTALRDKIEMISTSFQCFCDLGNCALHATKRAMSSDLVVKFSAIKRSISTPNITLLPSLSSTTENNKMIKNKSVSSNLEEPYAVVSIQDIIKRNEAYSSSNKDLDSPGYVQMSPHSTLSSSDRPYSIKDIAEVISLGTIKKSFDTNPTCVSSLQMPLRKSISSEHSGNWSLQSCNSNTTVISDISFKTCLEGSSDDGSDETLHSDGDTSDTETIKSDVSTTKRPWVHSSSFRYGNGKTDNDSAIEEEPLVSHTASDKFESIQNSESSSECEDDSGVPGIGADVSLDASLERVSRMAGGHSSGSGRRRWDEAEGTSEGDALSISSAASSCAPLHLAYRHEHSKVSPTPPKKPPRRNLSVSPTHVNSPSSGYSYELRTHARSQDDLDDIQGAKHYLKHGRSIDQYVDSKLSYSEYEENHNSPRTKPVPKPRPSLKNRTQPVAITAMYENVVIKEQNPRRKLRRSNLGPQYENFETTMTDKRVRKYSNKEKSSLESLLDDSVNSPSNCERYYEDARSDIPLSPTHYEQPPTPDHPPPSAKQAENSIHERIRPLSQLIMEVVEEIRIRKKSQGDVTNS